MSMFAIKPLNVESFRKISAEFVAVFLLTLAFAGQPSLSGLAQAPAYLVLMYAFKPISGAHLSPTITLTMWWRGRIDILLGVLYILAQFVGALVGAAVAKAWLAEVLWDYRVGKTTLLHGVSDGRGLAIGSTLNAFFAWSYLMLLTSSDQRKNSHYGLAFFALVADSISGAGSFLGSVVNPVIPTALHIVGSSDGMSWVYWGSCFLGSKIGAWLFFLSCPKDVNMFQPLRALWSKYATTSIPKLVVEFLGTFYLTYSVVMSTNAYLLPALGAVVPFVLVAMVYVGGPTSGGSYNPAVNIALFIRKRLDLRTTIGYTGVQILGGLFAGWIANETLDTSIKFHPFDSEDTFKALLGEIVFTFLLCFTVLTVTSPACPNTYFGIAIGFAIMVGGMAVGSVSGAVFNQAVATGLCSQAGFGRWWVYYLGDTIGGVLAGVLHKWWFWPRADEEEEADDDAPQTGGYTDLPDKGTAV